MHEVAELLRRELAAADVLRHRSGRKRLEEDSGFTIDLGLKAAHAVVRLGLRVLSAVEVGTRRAVSRGGA